MKRFFSKYKIPLLFLLFILCLWHLYCVIPIINHDESNIGNIKIYDRYNTLIAHLPKQDGFYIPLQENESISEKFIDTLLKIEDKRFYPHFGIDFLAKGRAMLSNFRAGRIVSGGSTLTEQYIKNRYFRGNRRSLIQKLRESTLAFYVSLFKSKDEIMNGYLNSLYFGNRIYGIKSASYVYFQKSDLRALIDQEIITLLAIIRSPSTNTTKEKYFQNTFERISKQSEINTTVPEIKFTAFSSLNIFPHVTTKIFQDIEKYKSPELNIYSTIDFSLQKKAKSKINTALINLDGHKVSNGAAYVFQPHTGEILVWQGSKKFYDENIDGQVNVIEQKRQMGSALKPFVYLYAFLNGAHPDHLIVDLEKDFYTKQDKHRVFRPLNYSLRESGVIPLKEALANSMNISAVRLLSYLDISKTYNFFKELELELDYPPQHYGLSLALGSPDLTMKNVAETYGVLANDGKKIETHLIRKIVNEYGEEVFSHELSQKNMMYNFPSVNESLFHLYTTLSSQINRSRSFGLNSILNTSIPFAVKTGTTMNFRDNWTFGYRGDLVVAVWVGNNNNTPMIDVTGVTGAGPIWHRVTEEAIKNGYVEDIKVVPPSTLQAKNKCLDKECYRMETIYQSDNKKWISDFSSGHFCLEDFYIRDIDPAEIMKVSKLFQFPDFSIDWCAMDATISNSKQKGKVLKPKENEVFYIRKDLPLELQKIIVKANQEVSWIVNGKDYGKSDVIFILPEEEKYVVEVGGEQRTFFVEM